MERTKTSAKTGQVLLTAQQITAHMNKLAREIKAAYVGSPKVTVVVLLNGAKYFADELFRLINDDKFEIVYIKASSYRDRLTSSGIVEVRGLEKFALAGTDVLIIDDIYDSGLTMTKVVDAVSCKNPRSVHTCVLLIKQAERFSCVDIDFKAAEVDDCFVVGYGLDYKGQFRELPFIARLEIESDSLSQESRE